MWPALLPEMKGREQVMNQPLRVGSGRLQVMKQRLRVGSERLHVGKQGLRVASEPLQVMKELLHVMSEGLHVIFRLLCLGRWFSGVGDFIVQDDSFLAVILLICAENPC